MTDRRSFLFGAAGAILWSGDAGTNPLRVESPADALTALVRLQARLDGRDAPWWYFGRIYGVMPDQPPRLLVRFEGLEIARFTRIGRDEYAVTGVTTSFFQDPATKQVLASFTNPYTHETNAVAPNRIGGDGKRAFAFYTPSGVRFARSGAPAGDGTGLRLGWSFHGDTAYLSHERDFPPGLPQPLLESSCTRARIADLRDGRRAFVPAAFSSTYVNQWPRWMNMAGQPGHSVWHADGLKFASTRDLPAEFLQRMQTQFPERLSAPGYQPE